MPCLLLSVFLSIPVEVAGVRSAALHRPEGAGPWPAVLMIEGWWTAQPWDASAADHAQHGFADPQNPWGGYDAKAADDSWSRAREFLAARLGRSADPAAAVACVIDAWNAAHLERSRKCYADSAVAVWSGERKTIDWEAERRYRAFDAAARSRFRFDVLAARDSTVDFALHETNDFLEALGLEGVTVHWRYVVREGRIVEEEFLKADDAFPGVLREFTAWGRARQPEGWGAVTNATGGVHFDGKTAPTLVALARQWLRSRLSERATMRFEVLDSRKRIDRALGRDLVIRAHREEDARGTHMGWRLEVVDRRLEESPNFLYECLCGHGPHPTDLFAWHLHRPDAVANLGPLSERVLPVWGYPYELRVRCEGCEVEASEETARFTRGTIEIGWKRLATSNPRPRTLSSFRR
jgi:hypothetical protein